MTFGRGLAAVLGLLSWQLLPACQAHVGSVAPVSLPRAPAPGAAPTALTVNHPGLYPETVTYDPIGRQFLLGSFREGAVVTVDMTGRASRLIDDPRLISVLGVAVDSSRGHVWAVSADLGVGAKHSVGGPKSEASVGVFELSTGTPVRFVDLASLLPGPHLLNGIALDGAENAYITDSFAQAIYRVTADGGRSVFLRSDEFAGAGVNLNGLVVHPHGYLLVVKKSDGALFRVPLAAPESFTRVALDRPIVGADGILLASPRCGVVVANKTPAAATNAVLVLDTDDDWASARIRAEYPLGDVYPTTATLKDGKLMVLHSKLDELLQSSPEQRPTLNRSASLERMDALSL